MSSDAILLILLNFVLCVLAFLTRKKRIINNIFILCASVIVTLSVIELGYRLFFENETFYAKKFYKDFFQPDSALGYKMNRAGRYDAIKMNSRGDTLFKTSYTIIPDSGANDSGFPHRIAFRDTSIGNEVIFLGCSFTFGEGLSDRQNLPFLVGDLSESNTVNLGCTGYGLHQIYQLFHEKFRNADNRGRVFVYSFLYDHILRANGIYEWNQRGPFFMPKGDSIVRKSSVYDLHNHSINRFIRYASLFGSLHFIEKLLSASIEVRRLRALTPNDYNNSLKMVYQMARSIKKSGGRFIVLDWDNKNWANEELNTLPFQQLEQKLNELPSLGAEVIRISSIAGLNDPANFIHGDGHPSEWMNYQIAMRLKEEITKNQEPRSKIQDPNK